MKGIDFLLCNAQRIAESYFFLTSAEKSAPANCSHMLISRMILGGHAIELFLEGLNLYCERTPHSVPVDDYLEKREYEKDFISQNKRAKGSHNLYNQLRSLPSYLQILIRSNIEKHYRKTRLGPPLIDATCGAEEFDTWLKRSAEVTKNFRYLHDEKKYKAAMETSDIFIDALVTVLYNLVTENKEKFAQK